MFDLIQIGYRVVAFIHDEIVIEIDEQTGDAVDYSADADLASSTP